MTRVRVASVCLAVAAIAAACALGSPSATSECRGSRDFADAAATVEVEALGDPVWTMRSDEATFSSPRAVDLTGDGVLDIVQGFGQDTFGESESSVIATDGATGERLWISTGHEDLIGSATFAELGGDGTPDVVIGGRRGALVALDGANGSLLWAFDAQNGRWFNFYTPQLVDDQNGDGVDDIVASNGGLIFDEPAEDAARLDPEKRNLGTTFVVSGADGSVIASLATADRRESYMSPVVLPSDDDGEVDVLIGTGGETLPGSLWRMPLSALIAETNDVTEEILTGGDKGMIAAPSVAHLTPDCVLDIVVQSFDGSVSAIDGVTDSVLWTMSNDGFETYSSPTLGYFVGDDRTPDVFVGVALGVWPEYTSSDYLLIDGATGEQVWRTTMGTFAPSGFVAVDLNGDGRDEIIFGVNDPSENTQHLHVLDVSSGAPQLLVELEQTTFASPWVGDLDGDGFVDLVTTESSYQSAGAAVVRRFELPWAPAPTQVSWGGYLGTHGTGRLNEAE